MRFAFSFITLAVTAIAAAQSHHSINPDPSIAHPIAEVGAPASTEPLTNAKRFANGLPPLSPKAHRHRPYRLGPHGGTGVDTARRAVSSPLPPVNAKCNILVKGTDGTTYGYLSPVWNIFGEYGTFQDGQDGALEVSFSYLPDSPDSLSRLDFFATNGPNSRYPYVGAALGFLSDSNDFSEGSFNWAYVAGTTQIPAGPAVEGDNNSFGGTTGIPVTTESAIWNYDPTTQAITAQWINSDGSEPATHLVYTNDGNDALLLAGDVDALNNFVGASYPTVTFTCVPPKAAEPVPLA